MDIDTFRPTGPQVAVIDVDHEWVDPMAYPECVSLTATVTLSNGWNRG